MDDDPTRVTTDMRITEDQVIHRRTERFAKDETTEIDLRHRGRLPINYCDALVRIPGNSYRHCEAVGIYHVIAAETVFHRTGINLCPSHKNALSVTLPS